MDKSKKIVAGPALKNSAFYPSATALEEKYYLTLTDRQLTNWLRAVNAWGAAHPEPAYLKSAA